MRRVYHWIRRTLNQSNLNKKYLSVTIALKLILLFVFFFIVFNKLTHKVRFDTEVRSPN